MNHITELSRGKLYHYEANYSRYLELREQRAQMAEASERKRQSILRVEREWILRGCQARSTKSKERIQRYEELKDQKAPERDSTVQLSAASSRLGKRSSHWSTSPRAMTGGRSSVIFLRPSAQRPHRHRGPKRRGQIDAPARARGRASAGQRHGRAGRDGQDRSFSQEGRELDLNQRVYDLSTMSPHR